MIPPATSTLSAPGAQPFNSSQVSRICLISGGVLLAAGCVLGAALPGNRAWSLMMLFFSVALFAAAGMFEQLVAGFPPPRIVWQAA